MPLSIQFTGYGLRPGTVVLFSLPVSAKRPQVEVGVVLTVWRGLKNPRPHGGEVKVASCVAFRVVKLDLADQVAQCSWQHGE